MKTGEIYEGDWLNNKIEGEGIFKGETEFSGHFRNSWFSQADQLDLKIEKKREMKIDKIKNEIREILSTILDSF